MKIVLLALGSRGDVQPMVAFGRELAGRDLPVTIVAMRDYAGLVEGAGLNFAPIDRSITESVLAAAGPDGRVSTNPISFIRGASRWLAGIAPQVMAAELATVQPGDLVVAGLVSIDDAPGADRVRPHGTPNPQVTSAPCGLGQPRVRGTR